MCSMNTRKSIFFSQTSVRIQLYKQLGYMRISSCYGCRYHAVNLVDLLSFLSNNIDSSKNCRNYTINLDTKRISSYYGCRCQAVNLVDLLSRSSVIIEPTLSCRNFSTYLDTKSISNNFYLHNLYYVLLFVVSFTDCIFDAFNCRNHCIFKVLCVRHWHILTCTTANRCIQVIKCF